MAGLALAMVVAVMVAEGDKEWARAAAWVAWVKAVAEREAAAASVAASMAVAAAVVAAAVAVAAVAAAVAAVPAAAMVAESCHLTARGRERLRQLPFRFHCTAAGGVR